MKLNLGCGLDRRQGYVNIDKRKEVQPDLVLDLEDGKLPFPDSSCSEILAHDVLEHLSWRKVRALLRECLRVLEPGGVLKLRVPDLELIYKLRFGQDFEEISFWVYGAQDYPENTHKAGFTMASLRKLLESEGFEILKMGSDGVTNILCEAVKNPRTSY